MRICIFEDTYVANLSPLNYFRHTSELICGSFTLLEKIQKQTNGSIKISLHCRKYLESYLKERLSHFHINSLENDDYLFLNSRLVYNQKYLRNLLQGTKREKDFLHTINDNIIAFHVSSGNLSRAKALIESGSDDNLLSVDKLFTLNLNKLNIDSNPALKIMNYPWDLIKHHENEITNDLSLLFSDGKKQNKRVKGLDIINSKDVYVSPKSIVSQGVVLDASKGKIFISGPAKIESFTYIQGPAYIGENSLIKSGTTIYGPVCIRSNSKISGEITHSIIHSFVNKQHLGFLGHSYLCEWINLGAGTTTSNLKNNYSTISVRFGNDSVNTESIFLGSMIGDHTKTGINTLLNTGSIVGVSSNLFGGGYMPKLVRSFTWLDADNRSTYLYEIEKALNTAKTSMQRRDISMSKAYEELFNFLFKKTQENLI